MLNSLKLGKSECHGEGNIWVCKAQKCANYLFLAQGHITYWPKRILNLIDIDNNEWDQDLLNGLFLLYDLSPKDKKNF